MALKDVNEKLERKQRCLSFPALPRVERRVTYLLPYMDGFGIISCQLLRWGSGRTKEDKNRY